MLALETRVRVDACGYGRQYGTLLLSAAPSPWLASRSAMGSNKHLALVRLQQMQTS